MTTVAVPPATTSASASSGSRFPAVTANLLPESVSSKRAAGKARRTAVIVVGSAVALVAALTGVATLRTASANSDLSSAQHQATSLTNQQNTYASLVQAKARTAAVQSELAGLMTDDLNWSKFYGAVRGAAPSGVNVTGLSGTVNTLGYAAAGSATGAQIFNTSNLPSVGTLTVSGSASSKALIAAYVDALGKVTGVAAPYPSSIGTTGTGNQAVSFTLTCVITSAALGGRFTPKPATAANTGGTR